MERPRQARGLEWNWEVEVLTFLIPCEGTGLEYAVLQGPLGHDVDRVVDDLLVIRRPALEEVDGGEVQPTLREGHDQHQGEGNQAEH